MTTKSKLIKRICDCRPNIFHKDIESAVTIIFDEIANSLKAGFKYEIRRFGTFKVKLRKARTARNPKTNQTLSIAEKKIPYFKMSKIMRLRLNKNFKRTEINNIQ